MVRAFSSCKVLDQLLKKHRPPNQRQTKIKRPNSGANRTQAYPHSQHPQALCANTRPKDRSYQSHLKGQSSASAIMPLSSKSKSDQYHA